jgi:uncharacterized integral membrane protein
MKRLVLADAILLVPAPTAAFAAASAHESGGLNSTEWFGIAVGIILIILIFIWIFIRWRSNWPY